MINIIHQDDSIIVVNKVPGSPVQSDKTGDTPLIQQIQSQIKGDLHLVHRLDRPASGVIVFARSLLVLNDLNEQFKKRQVKKTYWAVVGNKPESETGTLTHYLRKDEAKNRSFAFNKALHHTQKAELSYRLIASIERYHLLEINLLTGRHHQIRAQLAAIGSPIKGDVKYGFRRGNRDRSIHLHAQQLTFINPDTQKEATFTAPTPELDNVWKAIVELVEEKK